MNPDRSRCPAGDRSRQVPIPRRQPQQVQAGSQRGLSRNTAHSPHRAMDAIAARLDHLLSIARLDRVRAAVAGAEEQRLVAQ